MAIDDNTSYELTGYQVKDLAQKIRGKADDDVFVGAGTSVAGSRGLVPAPVAGDNTKFLKGDGTWGAVAKNNVDSSSYSGSSEDGWDVSYLPNGKKMWSKNGQSTTSSYTVGTGYWGYASNIAELPTSVSDISDVYVMGWASPTSASGSTKVFLYNGGLVGGARKFGIVANELYGSGTTATTANWSITLIEK